ncbi:MAG: DUF1667 domain-containing protein [Defluviitaleaceae bacterium]|nr:DUF1667 domain-containing protein [Defluviitaleaceae bacterium]
MLELICIGCPVGCLLQADTRDKDDIKISGNACKIGIDYGIKEITDPRRIVTSSVSVNTPNGNYIVSLKTNGDVPKNHIFDVLEEMKKLQLKAEDAKIGNIVIKNVLGLDADIVVTRGI